MRLFCEMTSFNTKEGFFIFDYFNILPFGLISNRPQS